MRTVASVGDKPLPSVSGEPGASLRADADDLDLPPSSGSRISGRVYDERGKPVPNAKVRLAVTSSPGGKVVYATTERAGAFTLRGLRPGSSYAVIAEYQGEDGIMTGRAQAKAPQVDVRISLQPRDGESSQGHASIQPARPRVEPISNIDPVDDETSDEARSAGRDQHRGPRLAGRRCRVARASAERAPVASGGTTVRPRRFAAGWNSRQVRLEQGRHAQGQVTGFQRRRGSGGLPIAACVMSQAPISTMTGPIPCPPLSIPPRFLRGIRQTPLDEHPVKVARGSTRSVGQYRAPNRPRVRLARRSTTRRSASWMAPGEREPRSMPEDILPGARVITPGSSAPIAVNETPDDDSPPAASPRSSRRSAAPAPAARPIRRDDADSSRRPSRCAGDHRWRVQHRRAADVAPRWPAISRKCLSMNRFGGPPAMPGGRRSRRRHADRQGTGRQSRTLLDCSADRGRRLMRR